MNNQFDDNKLFDFLLKNGENLEPYCIELKQVYLPVKENLVLFEEIAECINEHYVNKNLNQPNILEEDIIFWEIIKSFEQIQFILNKKNCLSYLISMWILIVFGNYNKNDDVFDEIGVWKSRYEIINSLVRILSNFRIFLNKMTNTNVHMSKNTKNAFVTIVHILEIKNLVKFKNKKSAKNKTEKYVHIAINTRFNSNVFNLKFFLEKQSIELINNLLYYKAKHYVNIKPLIHHNKRSKSKTNKINLDFINKQLGLKLYVNWELLDKFKKIYLEHFGFDNSTVENEFNDYLKYLQLNSWDKTKQIKLNNLYNLKYVYALLNLKKNIVNGIYFTYYFDFRGRVYTDSVIGCTHNKMFRYIYYYGEYTKAEIDKFCLKLNNCKFEYVEYIANNTDVLDRYKNFNVSDNLYRYYLTVVFFEIGKIFKNDVVSKNAGILTEQLLIECGVNFYNTWASNDLKLEKKFEIYYLLYILEAVNKFKFLKFPVYKDATASAIQILMLLLKSNDNENYKVCNFLHENAWYDTYYFIILEFYKRTEIDEKIKGEYFTRNNLKKTIMTYNYEAKYLTCWKDFCVNAGIEFSKKDVSSQEYKNLEKTFKLFYNFLKELFETQKFFKHPSQEILNVFKNRWKTHQELFWITPDDFDVKLDYYTIIKMRLDRLILNRETIVWNIKSDEIDIEKVFRALRANIIHSLDGWLVRLIINKLDKPIITIHDSFGIDILYIEDLQKTVKTEYQHVFDLNLFNIDKNFNKITIKSNYILL